MGKKQVDTRQSGSSTDRHVSMAAARVHAFGYNLPRRNSGDVQEVVTRCLAAVPSHLAAGDSSLVTCSACLRHIKRVLAASERRRRTAMNRTNCEKPEETPIPQHVEQVLTVGEAAQVIRCSRAHLLNIVHGRVANVPPVPYVRVGRRLLFRRESLERWLAAIESPTGTGA